jgi:hypothetical protein
VQQPSALGSGQHSDGAGASGGAQIRALQRVDRDIHRGRRCRTVPRPDFLADVEHRRFVRFALTDDDGAVHQDGVHRAAHGFHRGMVGSLGVSHSHGARRCDGGFLYNP